MIGKLSMSSQNFDVLIKHCQFLIAYNNVFFEVDTRPVDIKKILWKSLKST